MRTTMMSFPLTLTHLLDRVGRFHGRTELVSRLPDKSLHRYRYVDFQRRARQLAAALANAGLAPGDRVATLMWNHYAHLEAYFGIPAAGGVLHTLNLRLHPEDIGFIARHAGDRFLIVDDVLLPLLESFKAQAPFERVFVVSLNGQPIPREFEDYERFLAAAPAEFAYPALEEDAPCGMCYTSGTTGRPKGVVYSHRSTILHAFAAVAPDAMNMSGRDVVLPVVPMFHANAWAIPYSAVMVGAKQVFPGPHLDAPSVLDLMAAERVSLSAGVPTIWLSLLEALRAHPGRWPLTPGMRMMVGGSAVPESLIRAYAELGLSIMQGWGMTETSPLATLSIIKPGLDPSPDEAFALKAKQGITVPFVEIRIMSEAGEQPWDGESVGEVELRGPWITGSYHDLPASEAGNFTPDAWLKTGDVGTIDPEGYLKLSDRAKDLIKSGGEWISSVDLENAIMGHPDVLEAAVIAVPHPKWAERPLAVVVPRQGASPTAEAIRNHLAGQFAKWQLPDAIVFVDAIPRTSTGKFLKTKLREQYKDWRWQ